MSLESNVGGSSDPISEASPVVCTIAQLPKRGSGPRRIYILPGNQQYGAHLLKLLETVLTAENWEAVAVQFPEYRSPIDLFAGIVRIVLKSPPLFEVSRKELIPILLSFFPRLDLPQLNFDDPCVHPRSPNNPEYSLALNHNDTIVLSFESPIFREDEDAYSSLVRYHDGDFLRLFMRTMIYLERRPDMFNKPRSESYDERRQLAIIRSLAGFCETRPELNDYTILKSILEKLQNPLQELVGDANEVVREKTIAYLDNVVKQFFMRLLITKRNLMVRVLSGSIRADHQQPCYQAFDLEALKGTAAQLLPRCQKILGLDRYVAIDSQDKQVAYYVPPDINIVAAKAVPGDIERDFLYLADFEPLSGEITAIGYLFAALTTSRGEPVVDELALPAFVRAWMGTGDYFSPSEVLWNGEILESLQEPLYPDDPRHHIHAIGVFAEQAAGPVNEEAPDQPQGDGQDPDHQEDAGFDAKLA